MIGAVAVGDAYNKEVQHKNMHWQGITRFSASSLCQPCNVPSNELFFFQHGVDENKHVTYSLISLFEAPSGSPYDNTRGGRQSF